MQNKQLHSDWQQESAGKNLVGFVKYQLLGCQTVKWEIKKNNQKRKNQPPNPKQTLSPKKKKKEKKIVLWLYFNFFKNKILYTNNFFNRRVFKIFFIEP